VAQRTKDQPADTLEELESLGERMAQWVGANPVLVLGIAGLILALAASVGGYRAWEHSRSDRASTALAALHAEYVTAMGGKPTDTEVPEPANPETAKAVRTDFAARYEQLAKEWSGTATGSLALLEAGEIREKLGDGAKALELWLSAAQSAAADSPVLGVIQSRIGHFEEDRGDFEAAARAHEAAANVAGYPLHGDALAAAARTWAEAGKPEQALAQYRRLETEAPDFQIPPYIEARMAELESRTAGASVPAQAEAAAPESP
jgi:tetratricopeptide (TPR) repeat protein